MHISIRYATASNLLHDEEEKPRSSLVKAYFVTPIEEERSITHVLLVTRNVRDSAKDSQVRLKM